MTEIPSTHSLWHRIRPWLGLLALFLAGVLVGSVLTLKIAKHKLQALASAPPSKINELIMKRLDAKLDLSPEQESRIASIIQGRQEKLQGLRTKVAPEIVEVLQGGRQEIEAELNPRQKELFKAWADEKRANFQRFLTP